MDTNNILLSIVVITYNHESYIRQALDSILVQEVDFKYEILVGEDCSPDNTRLILEEYRINYPDKFIMIYRDENIGGRRNLLDLYERARGEYIAQLEGDDFWTSKNKLQKQVDYLKAHKDVIATAHRTKVVNEYGEEIEDKKYPECNTEFYNFKKYKHGILPGQSASLVMRNFLKENIFDLRILNNIPKFMPSDRVIMYLLASYGSIYCFQEIMSAYRYVPNSGTSFSARQQKSRIVNIKNQIEYYYQIMLYSHEFIEKRESIIAIESIYFWHVLSGFLRKHRGVTWSHLRQSWTCTRNRKEVLTYVIYKILTLPIRRCYRKKGIIGR